MVGSRRRASEEHCGTVCAIYGLCNMRIVSGRSSDGKSVRPSMPHVNGGRRTASRILSNAAHQRISSGITNAVSPKLSRSDFVQLGKVGKDVIKEEVR